MTQELVRYRASDGTDVSMSPSSIVTALAGGTYVSDEDAMTIIARCKARGVNPLAGDAYVIVRAGHATLQVSKDYYLRVAAAQPTYDGMEAGIVVAKADGTLERRVGALVSSNPKVEKLVGGWAVVHDSKRSHPSEAVVSLAEYDQKQSLWRTKPATMIRKVAMVQALREAYPNAFTGIYDEAEMPVAEKEETEQQEEQEQ
jgi:phage recombination protein Bet